MNKAFVAVCVIAISAACNQSPREDAGSQTVAVTLPVGDVQAGRKAFVDLKCTACHAVYALETLRPSDARQGTKTP